MYNLQQEYQDIMNQTSIAGKSYDLIEIINHRIWDFIAKIPNNASIIIRGGGEHTEELMKTIRKKYTKEEFKLSAIVDNGQVGEIIDDVVVINQENAKTLDYDVVIISSYSFADEMKKEYDSDNYIIFDLYQELKEDGIFLLLPFYFYKKNCYEIPIYYIEKYKKEPCKKNLEYAIDAILEIKDFHTAFLYIDEYISLGYDEKGLYKKIRNDFEKLFEKIKQIIANRDGKDIIMFWIDAIPYMWLKWMPYIYSKKESSYFFEYVYTSTPYTHPTMHTLLQGLTKIDDYDNCRKEINESTSEVIQDLEMKGYKYLYIGYRGKGHIASKYIIKDDTVDCEDDRTTFNITICSIYWKMLCELVNEKKPVFYMVHSVIETHEPYIALNLENSRSYQSEISFRQKQYIKTFQYTDIQVKFYSDLLDDRITKIYMGDHGNVSLELNLWQFAERRIRTFFLVEGKKIPLQKIEKIFSYQKFKYIIKWLLSNNEKDLQAAFSDYAIIQDVDIYNPIRLKQHIEKHLFEFGMTFRGIVTKKDKYVRIGNGKEFYFILEGLEEREEDISKHKERVKKLREKAGNTFLDLDQYKEFHDSKKLYELAKNL